MNLFPPNTLARIENNVELTKGEWHLGNLLQQLGYKTGFVGKSHIMEHIVMNNTNNWHRLGLKTYPANEDPKYVAPQRVIVKVEINEMGVNDFHANQFRLFMYSAADVLLHTFRSEMLRLTEFARATMETIQLRLIKVAAFVKEIKNRKNRSI